MEELMRIATVGSVEIGTGNLAVLAGPCVAESLDLCLEVAEKMSAVCRKLSLGYVFKASFDKANRSSGTSFRGPGIDKGLEILAEVKKRFHVPVVTDIHESWQAKVAAEVVDLLQIPAFLCRQTDLLLASAATGLPVNVKKGQFLAPEDMKGVVGKLQDAGCRGILLTERGTTFGYHNLAVDFRGLQTMREFGVPLVFDATHSVQLPGGLGSCSGGQRQFIPALSRAAAAVGIDAIFMEVHPNPDKALSDGANSLPLEQTEQLLAKVKQIHDIA